MRLKDHQIKIQSSVRITMTIRKLNFIDHVSNRNMKLAQVVVELIQETASFSKVNILMSTRSQNLGMKVQKDKPGKLEAKIIAQLT